MSAARQNEDDLHVTLSGVVQEECTEKFSPVLVIGGKPSWQPSQQPFMACRHCHGVGGFTIRSRDGPNPFPCDACHGEGEMTEDDLTRYLSTELGLSRVDCPCRGTGGKDCYCAGSAMVIVDTFRRPYCAGIPDDFQRGDEFPLLRVYAQWEEEGFEKMLSRGRRGLHPWHLVNP